MPKRRKKSDRSERFLEHGYWDHPDPALTIRQLLARDTRLLASFNDTYEEEDGKPGLLAEWAEREGAPTAVRRAIRRGYDALAKARLDARFDGVLVAGGSGPDMEGVGTWNSSLVAYRRDGWIHYEVRGDGSAPNPTRLPLTRDQVYEVVAGDPYSAVDGAPDIVAECLTTNTPRRADIESALDHARWDTGVWSDFYDFSEIEKGIREGVLEALLERFGLLET